MKKYKCHKVVNAFQIVSIDGNRQGTNYLIGEEDNVSVDDDWMDKFSPEIGGYFVQYVDGYESFSPAAAFESGYTEMEDSGLSFGAAVSRLKSGQLVARTGWNGKGMFIYLVPENSYPVERNNLKTMGGVFPNDLVPYQPYIAMKTAQNTVVPWLASQSDVLAEDWRVVEVE